MKNRKFKSNPLLFDFKKPIRKFLMISLGLCLGFSSLSFQAWPLLLAPANIVAETTLPNASCSDVTDPNSCEGVQTLHKVLNWAAILIVPLIGLMVVIGGVQYSVAQNNPKALQEARGRIYKAITALILFIGMWSFLKWLIPGGWA